MKKIQVSTKILIAMVMLVSAFALFATQPAYAGPIVKAEPMGDVPASQPVETPNQCELPTPTWCPNLPLSLCMDVDCNGFVSNDVHEYIDKNGNTQYTLDEIKEFIEFCGSELNLVPNSQANRDYAENLGNLCTCPCITDWPNYRGKK